MGYYNKIKVIKKGDSIVPDFIWKMEESPETLYCIGDESLLTTRAVAVVGARKCSQYGRQIAMQTGKILAENSVTVISGMAAGIDGYAHRGAIEGNGKTIAVLGCGPDICYPESNRKIYEHICEEGLVISEYPPGTNPRPWFFPMRNRLISAFSEMVVVVEAGKESGSIITAEKAAEQGKEIMAVPGNISSILSQGTNRLIADGAAVMTCITDVLETIGIKPAEKSSEEILSGLGKDEETVVKIIMRQGETTVEELSNITGKSPSQISGIVAVLEVKGILSYSMGKIFIAKL